MQLNTFAARGDDVDYLKDMKKDSRRLTVDEALAIYNEATNVDDNITADEVVTRRSYGYIRAFVNDRVIVKATCASFRVEYIHDNQEEDDMTAEWIKFTYLYYIRNIHVILRDDARMLRMSMCRDHIMKAAEASNMDMSMMRLHAARHPHYATINGLRGVYKRHRITKMCIGRPKSLSDVTVTCKR